MFLILRNQQLNHPWKTARLHREIVLPSSTTMTTPGAHELHPERELGRSAVAAEGAFGKLKAVRESMAPSKKGVDSGLETKIRINGWLMDD